MKIGMRMVHVSIIQVGISLGPLRGCGLKDGLVVEVSGICLVVVEVITKEFQRTLR